MSSRDATVEIASFNTNGTVMFRLLRSSVMYPNMHKFETLDVNSAALPPLNNRGNVQNYGDALREALYLHPAVRAELTQIFGTRQPDRANLQFAIGAEEGEPFRWEALYADPNCFLAANGLCSLKRIAFASAVSDPGPRICAFPIRMAAFLSPSGVESQAEFSAISGAIGTARQNGLDIEATIYLGEQALLDQGVADVAAGKLPGIRVQPMPGDTFALEKVLVGEPVQIVHFFCHGYAPNNVPLLEFGTLNDHDIGAPHGSIGLSVERLAPALSAAGTVWLTVLSSCSSAQGLPRVFSMARELANTATPVAIGMAEPIQPGDANLFAGGFYSDALEAIRLAMQGLPVGATTQIDFGAAVARARKDLHGKAELLHQQAVQNGRVENAFGRWCLPVMYQRDAPLKIGLVHNIDMRKRIATYGKTLRDLPSDTPVDLRDQILAMLDKDPPVPPSLRPDRYGNFS